MDRGQVMALDDLKNIQRNGWIIESVDDEGTFCRCPSFGCNLRVKIKHGTNVRSCDPGLTRNPTEVQIGSYEDLRMFLRKRREQLLLTIPEVEEIAGLTAYHIAKAEKDNPSRLPELGTIILWSQALGYDVVLRPTQLSTMTLRFIDETRRFRGRRVQERDRRRRARGL